MDERRIKNVLKFIGEMYKGVRLKLKKVIISDLGPPQYTVQIIVRRHSINIVDKVKATLISLLPLDDFFIEVIIV